MNLIFIYGPPASGKLSVANELSKLTGYAVVHNHAILDAITPLFPFEDKALSEIRQPLARKIRQDIFQAAAGANVSCITTFGSAGEPYFDMYRDTRRVVEEEGGRVCFVQLIPSKDELLRRVGDDSRIKTKISTKERLTQWLKDNPTAFEKFSEVEHLSIDNSNIPAKSVAQQIADYYSLQ